MCYSDRLLNTDIDSCYMHKYQHAIEFSENKVTEKMLRKLGISLELRNLGNISLDAKCLWYRGDNRRVIYLLAFSFKIKSCLKYKFTSVTFPPNEGVYSSNTALRFLS